MEFTKNWEYRKALTQKSLPLIEVNRANSEVSFHHIPEKDYHDKLTNAIGVGNIAAHQYTGINDPTTETSFIQESAKDLVSKSKSYTPHLYTSFSDFRQPKGYHTSDLKVSFLSAYYSEARQVAPVIQIDYKK
jgi:hypothetical protein